ncbi:hypothetical protein TVAG_468650 [Trichomonas vaginalis G3]|uniref:Beige/BEACH domain containing protein n=1 Tax=Trichomonas vaginalis (strain ATCC PRA-98 / G3) TaxID=412133 RepID=A2F5X0_TRIV3|nr:aggrephagy protein [Trichomonas vaginalis G3]EAX99695.1 hypothetical protein TVAG_468650 [Trichomonas vaginalis G3]KAI5494130.1 aggrephagy protein [Trichomonas vaginalis G3]|eukprot:XP_001312625.1 hypothetical protein [Trichomonas vaginalis G3]
MYSILLENNVYQFNQHFFKMLQQFIQHNIDRANTIFRYLCSTISHVKTNSTEMQLLFKSIELTINTAEANSVDSSIIDNIITALANQLIEMNTDALHIFQTLIPFCNIQNHDFIFNQISVTLVKIILSECEAMEWPQNHGKIVKIDVEQDYPVIHDIICSTFQDGLPKFEQIHIERAKEYMSFCSQNTLDKIFLFLASISKYYDPSIIFVSSLFNEASKHTELGSIPQVYSALVFVCINLLSSLTNFNTAVYLAKTAIFDPSITIFDHPDHFKSMSRLRLETITISMKQGANSFNEFMNYIRPFPKLTAEVFYRLCDVASLYYLLIKQEQKAIRGVVDSFHYYTRLHMKNTEYKEEVERTRIAQLTFLNAMLQGKNAAELLYQDMDFVNYFITLLFEKSLRKWVLSQLLTFFKIGETTALNYIIGPLVTVFANNKNDFSSKEFTDLINDTVTMLAEFHHVRKGLASIVGPIHEGINLMIHVMPANEETEKILFTCINLFTEAGDDNMLTAESMTMLSASIINFYQGKPTKELYHRLIQLFIGDTSSEQKPEFEIKNRSVLILLFQVFINSTFSADLLDFLSKLFDFKISNCIIGHKVRFDLLLLNIINDFQMERENDLDKIKKILHLFQQIVMQATNKKVIHSFLHNLDPLPSGKMSKYHNMFVECLFDIIYKQYKSYNYCIYLEEEKTMLAASGQTPSHSFVFWISSNRLPEGKMEFMDIYSRGASIKLYIQENVMYAYVEQAKFLIEMGPVVKTLWHFVCITVEAAENKFKITTNLDFNCTINSCSFEANSFETFANLHNCSAEISYFAIFPILKHEIRPLYSLGPFTDIGSQKDAVAFVQKPFAKLCLPKKSISTILTEKYSFIPLIKRANNAAADIESTLYYVACFMKLAGFNTMAQQKLYDMKFMQAFAHALRLKPRDFISYELYLSLYNFFISITNIDLKDSIFKYVLSESLIWNNANPSVHEQIIAHWARVLFKSYMPRAAKLRPFSNLFEHFSHNYIESKLSRSSFQNVLITVASETFTVSDFTTIISYCSSCSNEEFSLYLMQFLNALMIEIPEKFKSVNISTERVATFQLLMNISDDKMMSCVIESIVQFERINDDKNMLSHIEAISFYIMPDKMRELFVAKITELMISDTPELLSLNCWAAVHASGIYDLEILKNALETINVVKKGPWMFWPLVLAIKVPQMTDSVIRFLFRSLNNDWVKILPNAYVACNACNVKNDKLLTEILLFVINKQKIDDIQSNYSDIIDAVVWYMSYNEIPIEDSLLFNLLKNDKSGIINTENLVPQSVQNVPEHQNVASPIIVQQRVRRIKRKTSYSVSAATSGIPLSDTTFLRTESYDAFFGSSVSSKSKKGPRQVVLINDFKNALIGNDQLMITYGMRVDETGNWADLKIAVTLCNFACNFYNAIPQINDDTVDKLCWLLVNVSKFDLHFAKKCAMTILQGRESLAPFLNNLPNITSVNFYRRMFEMPQRSEHIETVFQEVIEELRTYSTKFFERLLPKFTKGVMQIISEYETTLKERKRVTREMVEECKAAHDALIKLF